ncbi:MAG: DNA-processing protein DprA [Bacteroidota bacterium]
MGYDGHNSSDGVTTILGMDPFLRAPFPGQPSAVCPADPRYPARFSDLVGPPRQLWVSGRLPDDADQLIAVVGSRNVSAAGAARVTDLASELAMAGHGVISGGALGIDAAAHKGALAAGGVTFAVLGCGIDVVYPDRHADLFRRIAASGGVLSEYGPGVAPRPGQFPARNRLVAALARAVLVAESRRASGALITARLASAMGRPVLAIPGSAGADRLLASGAAVAVETVSDVRAVLAGRSLARTEAPSPFQALLSTLDGAPLAADLIARRLDLALADTLGLLLEAELSGLVARTPDGKFEGRRGR